MCKYTIAVKALTKGFAKIKKSAHFFIDAGRGK